MEPHLFKLESRSLVALFAMVTLNGLLGCGSQPVLESVLPSSLLPSSQIPPSQNALRLTSSDPLPTFKIAPNYLPDLQIFSPDQILHSMKIAKGRTWSPPDTNGLDPDSLSGTEPATISQTELERLARHFDTEKNPMDVFQEVTSQFDGQPVRSTIYQEDYDGPKFHSNYHWLNHYLARRLEGLNHSARQQLYSRHLSALTTRQDGLSYSQKFLSIALTGIAPLLDINYKPSHRYLGLDAGDGTTCLISPTQQVYCMVHHSVL